jgi:K+:H+ antiporter
MAAWESLLDVFILLSAALVLGVLAEQLRQSALVGYIVAGMLVGPNVFGWVQTRDEVTLIAEIGAALLLFAIGLEFSFQELRHMGVRTLFLGVLQILLTIAVGFIGARIFKLDSRTALILGCIFSLSSTACVVRVLIERTQLDSLFGRQAIGILLLQDVAVVPLVLLVTLLAERGNASQALLSLGRITGLGILLLGFLYLALNYVLPKLFLIQSLRRNRELPILLATIIAVGSAVLAHQVGLSPSFGAFLAGILLAESPFVRQIRADIGTLRILLVTLFFAAIGMFGNPIWIAQHIVSVLALVLIVLLGKTALIAGIMWLLKFPRRLRGATGLTVAQIGEFSFLLVTIAFSRQLIDLTLFRYIISVTLLSIICTPYLIRLASWYFLRSVEGGGAELTPPEMGEIPVTPILIIGFGPAGREVAQELAKIYRKEIVALDLNPHHKKKTQEMGISFAVGDATHIATLGDLSITSARTVVITIPDPKTCRQIIRLCKSVAPECPVIVRCRYHRYRDSLQHAGADFLIDEEQHLGSTMAQEVLKRLT